jgi:hypothetical protein
VPERADGTRGRGGDGTRQCLLAADGTRALSACVLSVGTHAALPGQTRAAGFNLLFEDGRGVAL